MVWPGPLNWFEFETLYYQLYNINEPYYDIPMRYKSALFAFIDRLLFLCFWSINYSRRTNMVVFINRLMPYSKDRDELKKKKIVLCVAVAVALFSKECYFLLKLEAASLFIYKIYYCFYFFLFSPLAVVWPHCCIKRIIKYRIQCACLLQQRKIIIYSYSNSSAVCDIRHTHTLLTPTILNARTLTIIKNKTYIFY